MRQVGVEISRLRGAFWQIIPGKNTKAVHFQQNVTKRQITEQENTAKIDDKE